MGKARKTKWAQIPSVANDKIDTSNPDQTLSVAKKRAADFLKKNSDNLYKVSTAKNTSATAAKVLKSNKKSEVEERRVAKIVKKLEKQPVAETKAPAPVAKVNKMAAPIFDVWDEPNVAFKTKPVLERYELVTNKAVVLPESGLSYNPNMQAYEETIGKVVAENVKTTNAKSQELIKRRTKHKIEKRRVTANKIKNSNFAGKSANEKEVLRKRDEQAKEKKLEQLTENYEKELDHRIRELNNKQKRHEKLLSNKAKKADDIKTGKLRTYNLKLSKHKLPTYVPPSLPMPDQMPENLRKIKTDATANIRDHFDSIFRRGLIEYKKIGKVQRRAKVKYHNKHTLKGKEDFYIDPQ